ncbi:MAG: ThuA domain-containing protein [Planctomycetota bacterium]
MRAVILLCSCLPAVAIGQSPGVGDVNSVRVLLLTGQNNHDWRATTPVLVEAIKQAGRFELSVEMKPWAMQPAALDNCDVVLSNWSTWPDTEADPWPADVKQAFLRKIEQGAGLVVVHAGSSVHYAWPEFQALVGATWRRGKTWHGPRHTFTVSPVGKHPITDGLKPFDTFDELWRDMAPTGDFRVLATADTSADKRPGPAAPMLLTTTRGEGRGVNLVLGHDARAMSDPNFQTLLLRSLEWAATGRVTLTHPPAEAAAPRR